MRKPLFLVAGMAALCVASAVVPGTASSASSVSSAGSAGSVGAAEVGGPPAPGQRWLLLETLLATLRFHDVHAAEAAGYQPVSECVEDPTMGGMGVHYLHPGLAADGVLDHRQPELLVYRPRPDGQMRLVAVEFFQPDADQNLGTDGDRPTIFGVPFDGPMPGHNPAMPVHYDLHVWLYKHNPSGLFAMWNPRVTCPPAPTP